MFGSFLRPALGLRPFVILILALGFASSRAPAASSQETRLLRQPTLSADLLAFTYGGDLWITDREGGEARRLTSTPAVEADPHLSPDGRWLAFSSNQSGSPSIYVVSVEGGNPTRLTWHPAPAFARGWTPDGTRVLYSSTRDAAPVGYGRLWTVPASGGPSERLPAPMGYRGAFSSDGRTIAIDQVSRWDEEWRNYRGGQNTPITLLDLDTLVETRLPNERTTDTQPVWLDGTLYFLSDRDYATNVWSYDPASGDLTQITRFADADVKSLASAPGMMVVEQDGWIHRVNPSSGETTRIPIRVSGDFPWATSRWEDVSRSAGSASLSPSGKRALMAARGEVFTVPAEKGDSRNLTRTPGAADRSPIWSPDGETIAWFSDSGSGYRLVLAPQDGLGDVRQIELGESKMGWTPSWSPDGRRIAFVDDRSRIRVLELESGRIETVDVNGSNWNRSDPAPVWSPDSKWLAYSRTYPNLYRRIVIWSLETGETRAITDALADADSPSWDRSGKYLYFLASTDLGLSSGFANTSSIGQSASYGAYLAVLDSAEPTPFPHESDEEPVKGDEEKGEEDTPQAPQDESPQEGPDEITVTIDFQGIDRRIIALPLPVSSYRGILAGPEGVAFIGEFDDDEPGTILHRFDLKEREAKEFATGVSAISVSADGKKILLRSGPGWRIVDTARPPGPGDGQLSVSLMARVEPEKEWTQIFDEVWRYERDYFYADNTHGADWDAVRRRYRPLVPFVRHRDDLNYILDQVGGELSVGHSFVFGGDMPDTENSRVGLLGADLEAAEGRWRIARIYTTESWNPNLDAPLDRPGLDVEEGHFLLAVDGRELTASEDPFRFLDGTVDRQTVLRVNDRPDMEGSWTVTVVPIRSENALRQRAWVEDNRRKVDELSGGRLAYVWVPNTGGGGFVSFNRYYFAQQDRLGAVVDERFNGGGNLDDYMVDLMNRSLRGGITNEAPGQPPFRLPMAGVLGPKVLLINEFAGSGGDYFPWAFRQLGIGPLIGTRTWGGLVASCVHYPLLDGGAITSPCGAVYDEDSQWVAENVGVPPDIEVIQDARSVAAGGDPQLEAAVREALRLLESQGVTLPPEPPFPVRARRPGGR